jgi:glycosyltransferase involved in cell wall biosynthesis
MKRTKVLYTYLGFYRDAGGEHSPLALAEELDRERFSFEIVTLMPTTSLTGRAVQATGCRIHDLGLGTPGLKNPVRLIKAVNALCRTFRRSEPDIVQTQSGYCNRWARLAAKLAGVPVVIATINFDEPKPEWFIRPIFNALDRWLAMHTAAFVCIAKHLVEEQLRLYERERAEIIYQPFDFTRFLAGRTSMPEIRALSDPARPLIGIVGRLAREKGHVVAISAMRKIVDAIPEAQLKVVGTGPLEAELKDQVAALGLLENVEFTGHRTDICDVMSNMDLLLVPSYSEAFGLVLLESIAAGVPLLGSRSGALPEILQNGEHGRLVEPYDPEALADAAVDIISNPAPSLIKLKHARAKVLQQYTKEESARRHASLYARLITGSLRT